MQGVRCNTTDVLQSVSFLLSACSLRSPLSLQSLDFSSCFTVFSGRLAGLARLQEVRVGADTPPALRSAVRHRAARTEAEAGLSAALPGLAHLPRLSCLVLKVGVAAGSPAPTILRPCPVTP